MRLKAQKNSLAALTLAHPMFSRLWLPIQVRGQEVSRPGGFEGEPPTRRWPRQPGPDGLLMPLRNPIGLYFHGT